MAIYLDDAPAALTGDDLAAVLEAARRAIHPAGRVIVEVQLNGRTLVGPELEQQLRAPMQDSDLHLYSATWRDTAAATLQAVRTRCTEARTAQQEAAKLFQEDQFNPGMARLGQAMDVWNEIPQALLQSAQVLGLDIGKWQSDGQTLNQLAHALAGQLKALRDLIETRDSVALADALAYEWPPTVDRWDEAAGELLRLAAT